RFAARGLHRENFVGDFFGGLGSLHRERFDFRCHHRKAPSGLAGPRRLDRGVERQQIGLAGNVLDQLDDVADLLRHMRKPGNVLVGGGGVGGGGANDLVGLAKLSALIETESSAAAAAALSTFAEAAFEPCTAPSARCKV